jgi:DDE superfamily endonuclease
LKDETIFWPPASEREQMCQCIVNDLPKCIGYLDGTHIPLDETPLDDPESYYSRKQEYSIQLQGIVDNNKRIRHLHVGFPGSVHDSRVFLNSSIGQRPEDFLQNGEWIAADSAYPNSEYIVTPFRKNAAVASEADRNKFNAYLSKHRVKVENAFGILKEVFGSLKELRIRVCKRKGHQSACEWIIACCVLYNIILPDIDEDDYEIQLDVEEEEQIDFPPAVNNEIRRNTIFHWVLGNI